MPSKNITENYLNNKQRILEVLSDTEALVKLVISKEVDPSCRTIAISLLRSLEDLTRKGVTYNKTLFVYKY